VYNQTVQFVNYSVHVDNPVTVSIA